MGTCCSNNQTSGEATHQPNSYQPLGLQNDNSNQYQENQNGNDSNNELRIGVDLFVKLKKGSITDFYKLGGILGEGAYGKVWMATHKIQGTVRAMKSIKKSTIVQEDYEKLFSEMNILKNLDHPHIVKLFELYEDEQQYYLVTEYCSGGELFDYIQELTYLSERQAADIMKQILSAVAYCHSKNIVHRFLNILKYLKNRDIKPENLLFVSKTEGAQIKLIDFGSCRKFTTYSKMTEQQGTPYYIAPEVLSRHYNEKCDVWSCGVILYILLCGYPPFTGSTEDEILDSVRQAKIIFHPEEWDQISIEAKDLIQRMLTRNPAQRITAEQAFKDSWIQSLAPTSSLNKATLQNLQTFQAKSKFKQALLTFIATQMVSQQEQEEFRKTFEALDINGDGNIRVNLLGQGHLSKEELIVGYTKVLENEFLAHEEVDKIMLIVDTDKSGYVDYTEFLVAAMNKDKLCTTQKIEQAFDSFDSDGNNFISREELANVMGTVDDKVWQQILQDCDMNNDGKISRDEFISLLKSKF